MSIRVDFCATELTDVTQVQKAVEAGSLDPLHPEYYVRNRAPAAELVLSCAKEVTLADNRQKFVDTLLERLAKEDQSISQITASWW